MSLKTLRVLTGLVAALAASGQVMARYELKLKDTIEARRAQEQHKEEAVTRAAKTSTAAGGGGALPDFSQSVFYNLPNGNVGAFLGARSANSAYNLSSVTLGGGASQQGATLTPMAQQRPALNGVPWPVPQDSALYTKGIRLLTVVNDGSAAKPVLTYGDAGDRIVLVPAADGAAILESQGLNDAAGFWGNGPIAGLAASKDTIFAAVPGGAAAPVRNVTAFYADNDHDRGIAMVKLDGNALAQQFNGGIDRDGRTLFTATRIDLRADPNNPVFVAPGLIPGRNAIGRMVATGIGASRNAGVAMHWDDSLQRLFVGLQELRRDNAAQEGGIVAVLVGRIVAGRNGPELVLEPIVNGPRPQMFTSAYQPDGTLGYDPAALGAGNALADYNSWDRIVGFYFDGLRLPRALAGNATAHTGDKNDSISIKFLRTMKTSTDKHYLIVASRIGATQGLFWVPLYNNDAGAQNNGKISLRNNQEALANSLATLPNARANRIDRYVDATSGVELNFIGNIDNITDISVQGDSVIVALAGADESQRGLFQATALFDAGGYVIGWTAITRVGGSLNAAYGAGFDQQMGNYYALATSDGRTRNTISGSSWADNSTLGSLRGLVEKHFPASKGGVQGVFSFDDSTSTFSQENGRGFAMTVILGYDSVMLAETMYQGRATKEYHDQESFDAAVAAGTLTRNSPDHANVVVFTDQALKDIAPLTCAEVTRVKPPVGAADEHLGYLYIGGYNGLVRLENAGAGWLTGRNAAGAVQGLSSVAALGGLAFAAVAPVSAKDADVRAIRSVTLGNDADRGALLVALRGGLFAGSAVAGFNLAKDPSLLPNGVNAVYDAVILKQKSGVAEGFIVATDVGLAAKWTGGGDVGVLPPLPNNDLLFALTYVSPLAGGVNADGGLLFVMGGSQGMNEGRVYCYRVGDVSAADPLLTLVNGMDGKPLTYDLNIFRRFVAADGLTLLSSRDMALDNTDLVTVLTRAMPKAATSLTAQVAPEAELGDFIGAPVREPITGAWLTAGSFGLAVNQ